MSTDKPRDASAGEVLVVEDDRNSLEFLTTLLTEAGFRVRPADTGELALRSVAARTPELILLDVRLPGIDGIEACRRLKADPATRDVPVLFISARHENDLKVKALEAGGLDYVTKPFSPPEILARIKNHIRMHRLQVDLTEKSAALAKEVEVRRQAEAELEKHRASLERQVAERTAELREREEKFRELVETISDVIFEVDGRGGITYVSPAGARIWGGELGDVVGRNFMELVHPEDREQLALRFAELAKGVERPMVYRFVNKSGRVLWGRSHSTPIWKDGRFAGARGVLMDITAQKEAEAEKDRLREKLAQARKMESVGRLAGGVAHDFNNMLGVILGYVEMALESLDSSQPLFEDLEEIRKAASRSADLTRQLLAFARRQPIAPRVLDLNETVAGMLRMLQRLIGEDIQLVWSPGSDLWPVRMDPSQIDQVLANLCVNARDAIHGRGGAVAIETSNETLDEAFCERNPGFAPGAYVRLTVRDDGRGMDEETLDNLFEPFFTTKAVGRGTGLGLATIYGIVKQNEGFISAASEPGEGTTFHLYLPRHSPGAAASPPADSPVLPEQGREMILLVEDEPTILKMTAMMLGRLGYEVLTAAAPEEAVRLAETHQGRIDLLITDVVMPGMNGRELAENLLALHPGLKRLFMSGYTADVIARHGMIDEGLHFIQKPFSTADLSARVREALESGPSG